MPEPTIVIRLHNMLFKAGYLKKEIGLLQTVSSLSDDTFFSESVPKDDYHRAPNDGSHSALVAKISKRRADEFIRSLGIRAIGSHLLPFEAHKLFDIRFNKLIRARSGLIMYYDANWLPARITDREINFRYEPMLYRIRLMDAEQVVDATTGQKRLGQTDLVKRVKILGQTDAELLESVTNMIDAVRSGQTPGVARHNLRPVWITLRQSTDLKSDFGLLLHHLYSAYHFVRSENERRDYKGRLATPN